VQIAEDPVAGADDGRRLAIDELPKRFAIAVENGSDCSPLIVIG
jgi:hypothetical protein